MWRQCHLHQGRGRSLYVPSMYPRREGLRVKEGEVKKYLITLEVESDTDPREWMFADSLVIEEEYKVIKIEEGERWVSV